MELCKAGVSKTHSENPPPPTPHRITRHEETNKTPPDEDNTKKQLDERTIRLIGFCLTDETI